MLQENLVSVNESANVENSSKEKINKVSAKKAKAQAKANNILYKDILANLNKSTEGLLKTSFGVKKSDIYKEEIFSELSDKEKKVARKKFRNTILSLSFTSIFARLASKEFINSLSKISLKLRFIDICLSIFVKSSNALEITLYDNCKYCFVLTETSKNRFGLI